MNHALYFQWTISTLFGWGVYGLNLLRHWQKAAGTPAYCIGQIQLESLGGMDPLSLRTLAQPLVDSDQMRIRLATQGSGGPLDGIVLHSLGNRFGGAKLPSAGGVTGRSTCGVIFFEDTILPDAAAIAGQYDLIITGSTWNEQVLRANGVSNVRTVIQGIEPATFHPSPCSDALEGRFAIFSGGKIEQRKGQDLVLLAFRAFAERHPEAILVTAWHSPWPIAALTVNSNPRIAPISLTAEGKLDVNAWAAANGLSADQFLDVGAIPNHLMARVLREMDVAVFPNRCEGGTNLVAMECMACGLPTIISDNTGHQDLVATGAPYPLTRQGAVISADVGTSGWGECDVDEIVESLEHVWANREEARRRGMAGAEAMAKLNWRNQIGCLRDALEPFGS